MKSAMIKHCLMAGVLLLPFVLNATAYENIHIKHAVAQADGKTHGIKDQCYRETIKKVLIDKDAVFSINKRDIERIFFAGYQNANYPTPFVNIGIDIKDGLTPKVTLRQGQTYSIFMDNDYISSLRSIDDITDSLPIVGCFTLEKAVSIIINYGFVPDYNSVKRTSSSRAFEERLADKNAPKTKAGAESEYWHVIKDANIHSEPDGPVVSEIAVGKIIEQSFDYAKGRFESRGDWIKIISPGSGWINRKSIVPFLSQLSNDLFFDLFFVFNENRFSADEETKDNDLLLKIKAVRKIYIDEARARLKRRHHLEEWYYLKFGVKFVE